MITKATTTLLVVTSLTLGGLAFSESESPSQTKEKSSTTATAKLLAETNLASFIVEGVELDDALRLWTHLLAKAQGGEEIKITYDPKTAQVAKPIKSLSLKNISAQLVLESICEFSGTDYVVGEGLINIVPREKAAKKTSALDKDEIVTNQALKAKMDAFQIKQANFQDATLQEVTGFLSLDTRRGGFDVNLLVNAGLGERKIKSIKMEQKSLTEVLEKVCEMTNTKFEIESSVILISDAK